MWFLNCSCFTTCATNRGVLVTQRWTLCCHMFFFCLLILCLWNFISRLREGIKLKIPPELLHKKCMKSREQSQALLEEVHSECHEANVWLLDDFQAQLSHWHKKGGTINLCVIRRYDFIGPFDMLFWSIWIWLLLFQYMVSSMLIMLMHADACWCMLLMCGSFASFLLAHC